ncbi:hypothetical protein [Bordetella genomosp. 6]|uniref:DUF551 domain-containing protein n=1 Tax=Bordetella genomosp. 6 TaxID=463024 RepID=A0ABX4FBP6_9BORD|nr:hypothetical protein [Bordetella genomosp. 6]OZI78078.1 hypothetical protein CAL23_13140 [Bordetella genomosp. 6]
MTTQPVLTDDQIRTIITDAHQSHGAFKTGYGLSLGRAIEQAVLSKLRAPVADELPHWEEVSAKLERDETLTPLELFILENEPAGDDANAWRDQLTAALASAPVSDERAAFEAWVRGHRPYESLRRKFKTDPYVPGVQCYWEAWQARAALASAPVAGAEAARTAAEWATPENVIAFPRTACAHIKGLASLIPSAASPLANAPVAGEAIAGYMVGTDYFRPDVLAAARIYAENRGLTVRPLVYGDAAPQASECECTRKSKAVADSEAEL